MNNYVRWDLGEVTRRRDYRGTAMPAEGEVRQPRTDTTRERRPVEEDLSYTVEKSQKRIPS